MTLRSFALRLLGVLAFAGILPGQSAASELCPALDTASPGARQAITDHLCFYTARPGEPAHQAVSPEELQADLPWQPANGHDLVFSHTDSVYWVQLRVRNTGDHQGLWYLKLNYPLLDEVTFWQEHEHPGAHGRPTEAATPLVTGDLYPFATRGIDYRYFLLPVTLDASESRIITIRVQSSGALNVPLALMTPGEVIAESNHLTLIHGLFYGALLILAMFNLLLFLSSGTRYYFYNAFYIGSMAMFLFAMGGFANQYFWPESTDLANSSIPLTLALCALAMALFGRSFLEVRTKTISESVLRGLAWSTAGFLALTFLLPYSKSILLNTVMALTVIVSLSVIATARWRQGYQPAAWYLAAWIVTVVGALAYAMAAFGYLGDYLAREVMMQAAIGGQVILLNYALVQRWRLLNQKLLDVEHQARTELELKVHERTAQLRNTMRELEQANQKLATLSVKDALTGLHNRRHMDSILPEMCLEARRTRQPMTLALVDADHFKRINDTWGHDFGDQCLKSIADCLNQQVRRPRDVAIRFGGEEFALLLPGTESDGALQLCQNILDTIRSSEIRTPDGDITQLTVSAGIAEFNAEEQPENLFRRADKALYQSKDAGRDTVTLAQPELSEEGVRTSSRN
ncbi:sensor domain-containing diguanylate cyclase [Marinobacter halophilus]|uniref:diguanylate cyclase n=1 Tax=Marinobacter halophilus TaxID=1323740 RepID=A0A2T1K8X2_9GAMM|nr:diguanylate cyclase [Marinobacter halophilus]PSF06601.1 sensor domain-containing diguanylate cyclase [Marinobacter halophilus]GGC74007.1 deoxynucleoside kinase [Marinobacter halophilus]